MKIKPHNVPSQTLQFHSESNFKILEICEAFKSAANSNEILAATSFYSPLKIDQMVCHYGHKFHRKNNIFFYRLNLSNGSKC